jgi:tripartite-type tricarboxylate transporter receptor subunit TctC
VVALARIAAFVLALAPLAASAQEPFPSRPIRLVVSFTPGGGADLTARTLAQKMTELLKQPMVVENRPGANGLVGAGAVAQSAPDGYTILLTDRGALGINPSLYKNMPYDPTRDFAYIGIATVAPYVLVVDPRLPVKTLADFIAYAKARPGKLNYGSYGIASMAHLNLEAFKARLGVDLVHVPYKGAGPAVQAVVAGEAAVTISSPAAVLGFVRESRLRALAIGAPQRSALLPDVPTLREAGVEEDLLASTYFALAAPAQTPRAVVQRLHEEMKRALAAPEVAERLHNAGLVPTGSTGDELLALVKRDIPRFRQLIQEIGIQPE